jgi:DNA-binding NtrC family response regulator
MNYQVLIVEDDKNALLGLSEILKDEGYHVDSAENGKQAIEFYKTKDYDALLTDFMLPDTDGLEITKNILKIHPETAIIMMTAFGSVKHAVTALKEGVDDYITKPIDIDELLIVLEKSIKEKNLIKENISLRDQLKGKYKFENIVGVSGKMQDVFKRISKVAPSNSTVLVRGESGTGKELVARAIHYNSNRSLKKIIEINCASIPENLLESELFGHEKGSFTGAHKLKKGKFEDANGGTLFLDEIGEMPIALQAKLLRALQEQKFTRVGGNQLIDVDVRVIAATNADLEQMIKEGEFREDLYFRLNVIPIQIPALRERKEDIGPLIDFLLEKEQKKFNDKNFEVTKDFLKACETYYWPGNVRELENALESAMVLCDNERLSVEDLPPYVVSKPQEETVIKSVDLEHLPFKQQLEVAEKTIIERALNDCDGNKTYAAKQLGFSIRTMRNKAKKYGI